MGNLTIALGASPADEQAQIEANVELVESLNAAAENSDDYWLPTALVLPVGCCSDEDRWFDRIEWHEISSGTPNFSVRRVMLILRTSFARPINVFPIARLRA